MSHGISVSRSNVRATLAVGDTPNTNRPSACRSSTAARSIVVFPVPAGPTISVSGSVPATAAAAWCWSTSSAAADTDVDGRGTPSWVSSAQVRIVSSWARISFDVMCAATGSIHSDRPSESRTLEPSPRVGSRLTQCSMTPSVARSRLVAHCVPLMPGIGRCRSQIVRNTSTRCHADPVADSASTTSAVVTGSSGVRERAAAATDAVTSSGVIPMSPASSNHRPRRSSTPWPDLWTRVSAAAWRVNAARSHRVGSRPSR